MIYAAGVAGAVNAAKSLYWLPTSAHQGSRRVQNKLGKFYAYGAGVSADPARAACWYGRAASAGYGLAQFNIALLYETGHGVPQSWAKAEQWLRLAASAGVRQADTELLFVRRPAARAAHQREIGIRPGKPCPADFIGTEPSCALFVDPAVRDIFSSPPP